LSHEGCNPLLRAHPRHRTGVSADRVTKGESNAGDVAKIDAIVQVLAPETKALVHEY